MSTAVSAEIVPRRAELHCPPVSRHATMVAALESAARAGAPLLTFHVGREPVLQSAPDVLEGAWRARAALRGAGVRRGKPVPILLPTSPALVHALFGTMLAGGVPAPLATPMTFGSVDRYLDTIAAVVEDSAATVAVADARLRSAMAADRRLQRLLRVVLGPEDLDVPLGSDPRSVSVSDDDLALLQYTSGTTGDPKGVAISHRALTSNGAAIARGLEIDTRDVGVSWLPLYHDMGLVGVLMTAVCNPYRVHVMRPEAFVMQPRKWLGVIAREGGTLSVAPNFAYELCVRRAGDFDGSLASWRVALSGAEPVRASTIERFRGRFADRGVRAETLTPVYGMAEATLAVTFSEPEAPPRTLRVDPDRLRVGDRICPRAGPRASEVVSVGRPVAGASVRIADSGGGTADEGVVGEILIGGASLMEGYLGRPDATEAALRDGWLCSGDLGFVEDGELYVVGRAKEVVIVGGRNIHPHDVERVAAEAPGVTGGVAAFGIESPESGTEALAVVVELRTRDGAIRERVARAVRGELLAALGVKAEVHAWPVGAIPRTTSGKVRRAACARVLTEPPR